MTLPPGTGSILGDLGVNCEDAAPLKLDWDNPSFLVKTPRCGVRDVLQQSLPLAISSVLLVLVVSVSSCPVFQYSTYPIV